MSENSVILRAVGYGAGTAIAASLIVLFAAMCAFGFHPAEWAEWEGRTVGVVGTIAGIVGAIFGTRIALHTSRPSSR